MFPAQPAPATERAWAELTEPLLEDLCVGMTNIPSPPGAELPLAQWCAGRMSSEGIEASVQLVHHTQANAVATMQSGVPGPELLLYSPIDTHLSGEPERDLPWAGLAEDGELAPLARRQGDHVVGLGANNPKGHAAAVMAAAIAIARAGVRVPGVLRVGLGAGGMPTNPETGFAAGSQIGHGSGCRHLLEQGGVPDAAVIAKSGDAVAWEEPGLVWFRVSVSGRLSYAGLRGSGAQRNPIVASARVIGALEKWLDHYADENEQGLIRPQGAISAVRGGWSHKLAFTPAACHLYLDLRIVPGVSAAAAERQLRAGLEGIRRELDDQGFALTVERLLSIPGSRTDPSAPIIRRTITAWELVSGRSHQPIERTSGATDANILRAWGVPTARVGMARVSEDCGIRDDFARAMNVCSITGMARLARILVATALEDPT